MQTVLTARDLLDRLVGFPTVSRDTNLPLMDFVEEYLDGYGVKAHRVFNADGDKCNLYAHVGPEVEGGVVLSGHTDVVPIDGQDWDTDPFTVVEKDGKLFGRGTTDMKGFDALALAAVPLALERGIKRPLQLALSYDEEVGCIGAPFMIDEMKTTLPRASAVIVGEPTGMQTVTGHKGTTGLDVTVHGFEVHSSLLHTGVSAIMVAAQLVEWCRQQTAANMARDPDPVAAIFEPPFTSLHVGMMNGGTAHNITAKTCRFTVDIREVPTESPAEWVEKFTAHARQIEAEACKIRPEARIEIRQYSASPGLRPEDDPVAEPLIRQLTGDNGTHVVSYGTEAGQFQERGYSTAICGPGDIAMAHQPNEYITVDQFQKGEAFMHRLIDHLVES